MLCFTDSELPREEARRSCLLPLRLSLPAWPRTKWRSTWTTRTPPSDPLTTRYTHNMEFISLPDIYLFSLSLSLITAFIWMYCDLPYKAYLYLCKIARHSSNKNWKINCSSTLIHIILIIACWISFLHNRQRDCYSNLPKQHHQVE